MQKTSIKSGTNRRPPKAMTAVRGLFCNQFDRLDGAATYPRSVRSRHLPEVAEPSANIALRDRPTHDTKHDTRRPFKRWWPWVRCVEMKRLGFGEPMPRGWRLGEGLSRVVPHNEYGVMIVRDVWTWIGWR